MGKCKDITRLLSDALDRSLTTGEWIAIRLHLPACSGCRNYRKQIRLLRMAAHAVSGIATADEAGEQRED
ncbi:zf-HC2 domain-containing protein [Paraburkholderia sp.]|uniref:zf-HC2 domain-containing protein n=1 Tax=Paraburkholderia sp. TaxID=1926495 RepID=UPI0039E5D898